MIFGDKNRFGIEYELDEDYDDPLMLGHICYWFGGQQVGDYETYVSLQSVLFLWERMSFDAGLRTNKQLMILDTKELTETLAAVFYSGNSLSDEAAQRALELRAIEEQWARHNITPGSVAFMGWRIFLIENDQKGRIVYHLFGTDKYDECLLEIGEVDQVLTEAIKPLQQILENDKNR